MNVISITTNRPAGEEKIKYYGIVFKDREIKKFIIVPNDYKVEEFMSIVMEEYLPIITNIIFDKNGLGIAFDDYLKQHGVNEIDYFNTREIDPNILSKAKEDLIDYALNSNFDRIGKIEYKKLTEELNNIEIEVKGNGCVGLRIVNKAIDVSRAICYLQLYNTIKI